MSDTAHRLKSTQVSVDFDFHYPDPNSNAWCVRIKSGGYEGLIVRYLDARVEKDDQNRNRLSFKYEVVRKPDLAHDVSNQNEYLTHILGNILAKIVLAIAEDKATSK